MQTAHVQLEHIANFRTCASVSKLETLMTHPLPEACKLPRKTLVARQLSTNKDVRE